MNPSVNQVYFAMVSFFAGDPKRIQHFIKVHSFAKLIAESEGMSESEKYVLEVTALMHDIGIKPAEAKYHSSAGNYQEQEGPQEAETMLRSLQAEPALIERVCYLIAHHHTYKDIQGLDYQILVEADFLVNLYEDGLPSKVAENVGRKIFRTQTGRKLLQEIFAVSL